MGRANNKSYFISHEQTIKKSNELSMAKLSHGLSLNQMQLLAYAIYSTQKNGTTEFHKSDFEKKFGIEQYRTEDAYKDSEQILGLKVSTQDLKNDRFKFWNAFMDMAYEEGVFSFSWHPEMIPHILELKHKFVTTDLTIASKFKSGYSWILYDYIKAHYGYWHKEIYKKEMLNLFNVEEVKSYQKNTSVFKRRVLDVAINEVNKYTELELYYKELKKGKAIKGFDLIWSAGEVVKQATQNQVKEINNLLDMILDDMFKYGEIADTNNRLQAMDILRETHRLKNRLDDDGLDNLTKNKAENIYLDLQQKQKTLESLYKKHLNGGDVYYNWLEED